MQNRLMLKQAKLLAGKLPKEFKSHLHYVEFSALNKGLQRTGCILCFHVNLKKIKEKASGNNPYGLINDFIIFGTIPGSLSEAIDYMDCDKTVSYTGNVYSSYNISELVEIISKCDLLDSYIKFIKRKITINDFSVAYDIDLIVEFLLKKF